MRGRARRFRCTWLSLMCGLGASRGAAAQQSVPHGAAPPVYYAAPAYPPGAPAPQPNVYPVTPRDYGAGPDTLGFRDGMFVPPGYHLSHRPHRGMLVAGLSVLGGAYVFGLTAGVFDGFDNQKGWLFLPVAGPWIASSRRRGCSTSSEISCRATDSSASFLLAADGIAQGAGVLTMLLAVAIQEKVLVRNDARVFVLPGRVGTCGAGITAYAVF